jgi:hypothetical protein
MMYYVQIEDDILTKPNFVATMRDFAMEKTAAKEPLTFANLVSSAKCFPPQVYQY